MTEQVGCEQEEGGFGTKVDGHPLRTPGGRVIMTHSRALIEAITEELSQLDDPEFEDGVLISPRSLSLYLIKSTEQDFIDQGGKSLLSCPVVPIR